MNNLFAKHKKIIISIVIVLILIGIPLQFLIKKTPSTNKNNNNNIIVPNAAQILKNAKPYTDTGNYYGINIPKTWTTSESTSEGTTGLNTDHPITHDTEVTQFYLPHDVSVTVQVDKTAPACPLNFQLDTTIAGFPAAYYPAQHMWEIPTKSAMITINITYPGSTGSHDPMRTALMPTPTEVPDALIKNDQVILNGIVNTIRFNNLQPLSC